MRCMLDLKYILRPSSNIIRTAVPSSPAFLPYVPANMPKSPAPRRPSNAHTVDPDAQAASRTALSELS
jgi:hypothetical protein